MLNGITGLPSGKSSGSGGSIWAKAQLLIFALWVPVGDSQYVSYMFVVFHMSIVSYFLRDWATES